MIKAEVYNQNIKLDCESVASDSVKYLKIKFSLNNDWENTIKTVVFKNEETAETVSVVLEEGNDLYLGDNTCYVPFEVIKPPAFLVSINGLKADTLITTLPERVRVYQSGDISGEEPEDYTPSQYEQLLSIYEKARDIAQSVRDDADNGAFNGRDGKDAVTDIKYNPESENAQSGKAVAEAINDLNCVFASGIKQNVSGKVIVANDVSQIEHELNIKVAADGITDFSGITVKRYGKNLADLTKGLNTNFKLNEDGSYTLSRAANGRSSANIPVYIPKETIIQITATILEDTTGMNALVQFTRSDGTPQYGAINVSTGVSQVKISTADAISFRFMLEAATTEGQYLNFKDFQIEIGTTPTAYEPYTEQITTADSDGTVRGITSISPNITLLTEDNVDLECEYIADTKLYIDNKIAAIK